MSELPFVVFSHAETGEAFKGPEGFAPDKEVKERRCQSPAVEKIFVFKVRGALRD